LGTFYANNDHKHQAVEDDDRYIAHLLELYGDGDELARRARRENQLYDQPQQRYHEPQQQYHEPQQQYHQLQQQPQKNTKNEVRILK
jgi:hypothetical protein